MTEQELVTELFGEGAQLGHDAEYDTYRAYVCDSRGQERVLLAGPTKRFHAMLVLLKGDRAQDAFMEKHAADNPPLLGLVKRVVGTDADGNVVRGVD